MLRSITDIIGLGGFLITTIRHEAGLALRNLDLDECLLSVCNRTTS